MVALVTLDFWQTLFSDTRDSLRQAHALRREGARLALAEASGLYTAPELAAADTRAGETFAAVWRERRDMTPAEQVWRFLVALDPELPGTLGDPVFAQIAGAHQKSALTHRPEITPAAVDTVRALRARGLTLSVISNTGRTPGRVLRRLLADAGILPCRDVLAFSDETGIRKAGGPDVPLE